MLGALRFRKSEAQSAFRSYNDSVDCYTDAVHILERDYPPETLHPHIRTYMHKCRQSSGLQWLRVVQMIQKHIFTWGIYTSEHVTCLAAGYCGNYLGHEDTFAFSVHWTFTRSSGCPWSLYFPNHYHAHIYDMQVNLPQIITNNVHGVHASVQSASSTVTLMERLDVWSSKARDGYNI